MFEPFGLVGGLSVGIPAVQVIDEYGNFISNVATAGNVSANIVTANAFKFANGANFTTQAAGSNTQVQYNNNNNFAGDANFTFDSTQALLTISNISVTGFTTLGDISTVSILGGNNGYFLQTDGAGALTWAPAGNGSGGNGTPGGANTQVQYNKEGDFGGDASFTYNDTTNTLSAQNINATTFTGNLVGNATRAGTVTSPAQPNITSVGTLANLSVAGNIRGANANLGNTVVANYFVGNFYGSANTANTVTDNAQPNITSVGTLVDLTVSGNTDLNILSVGQITTDLIPYDNISYDIGNLTNRWKDLYLSGNTIYLGDSTITSTANGISINGGNGYVVAKNLSEIPAANIVGQVANALVAGTVYVNAQPNITSVGTLTELAVSGNITAGNSVSANYFIGRLYGAANTAITVTGNAQPNITSVGPLSTLGVVGNITGGNANLGNLVVANYFSGDGGYLSNLQVSTANVGNANYAAYAGNVTISGQSNITTVGNLTNLTVVGNSNLGNVATANLFVGNVQGYATTVTGNAQPNINSVGTLTALAVTGNITGGNANLGNAVSANFFIGDGGHLSNLQISNASVSNANYAAYAGNVTIAGQSNITTVGNLTNLTVVGNSNLGNVATANLFVGNLTGYANAVTDNAQPNITSVGTLITLGVTGNITAGNVAGGNLVSANYLSGTLTTAAQANITTVGTLNGLSVNGNLVASNITANTGVISGNGSGLTNLNGANVTGVVANANYAVWSNYSAFAGFVTTNAQPNISSVGKLVTLEVTGNIYVDTNSFLGNLAYANYFIGDGSRLSNLNGGNIGNVANANYSIFSGHANTANTVTDNAQPNITSTGTLISLNVSGNANFTGNLRSSGNLRAYGNINFGGSPNIYIGDVSNLHIAGGFANYVLTTNGSGNLSWTSSGALGLSPGGPNTALQYNANGIFGGSAALEFDETSNTLTLAGNFVSDALQMGVGPNAFFTSSVFSATTMSMVPNQVLWSVPVTDISGVEFVIIATDADNSARQTCKIFASCYGSTVVYNEYAGLSINNGVGSFEVDYDSGTDSLRLMVTPDNINLAVYKILITQYAP